MLAFTSAALAAFTPAHAVVSTGLRVRATGPLLQLRDFLCDEAGVHDRFVDKVPLGTTT